MIFLEKFWPVRGVAEKVHVLREMTDSFRQAIATGSYHEIPNIHRAVLAAPTRTYNGWRATILTDEGTCIGAALRSQPGKVVCEFHPQRLQS